MNFSNALLKLSRVLTEHAPEADEIIFSKLSYYLSTVSCQLVKLNKTPRFNRTQEGFCSYNDELTEICEFAMIKLHDRA